MRPSALCLALLAVLALSLMPALAFERPAKPAVGERIVTRVNGVARRHHHHGYAGRSNGFYANGFRLLYSVSDYPRGVSAKFGAPRCYC